MTDVANSDRRKRNKGLMAITVITEITAIKSGKLGNYSSKEKRDSYNYLRSFFSLNRCS